MNDRLSSENGENGVEETSGERPSTDLERRLLLIRQQFQQQQADLLLQYQQKYAQLTLQHVQASQQLVEEFLHNQTTPPAQQFLHAVPNVCGGSGAGGGRTISDKTKEKLKEMIYNKHQHKQPSASRLTPQFQPYPPQWSPENELRKATSEPNLKIKGVQALRLKLMEKQQKELMESKQRQKQAQATAFFATPSLPNVALGEAAKLLSPPYWLAAALSNQSKTSGETTSFNLLHAQIRDLVSRRKSLVAEESEDDLRRELENKKDFLPSSTRTNGSKTGLAYDSTMCRHQCTCGDNGKHVEHGGRVQSIWARLHETGLADHCEKILSRKAPLDYLKLCHTSSFCTFFGVSPTACLKMDAQDLPLKSFVQLPCGGIGVDSDTYFNDSFTPSAARAAVGCAVELALAVAQGRLRNGLAVVRPPGHHAEPAQALGFCYFNNVAIAARVVKQKCPQVTKIAIVDWDVHHGNGTQMMFESDPQVLYLSLHRHDDGNFFPGTGSAEETGKNEGRGFTVNIPWSGEAMGDAEYLAAWRCIVEPVLDQFHADLILVSCGFDAAAGHWNAVGGYNLSSQMFGWMTARLASRCPVVLVLEGGYNLAAISDAAESCVRALLTLQCPSTAGTSSNDVSQFALAFDQLANESARRTLKRVCQIQQQFWPQVDWAPAFLTQNQFVQSGARLRQRFADLTMEQQQQQQRDAAWMMKAVKCEPPSVSSNECSSSNSSGDEKQGKMV